MAGGAFMAAPCKPADSAAPTPLYYIQTDSSTITTGAISAVTDTAGRSWSQATSSNRPIADTTTVPGHTVWKFDNSVTTRKWLVRNDAALAGALDGPIACAFNVYVKMVGMPTLSINDFIGNTLSTSSYSNPALRFGLRTDGCRLNANGGTRVTTYNSPLTFTGGWDLVSCTWDGSTTARFWLNGVQQGPDVTQLIPGTLTGMVNSVLGDAVSNSGGFTREYYLGGFAVYTQELLDTEMQTLKADFDASFV